MKLGFGISELSEERLRYTKQLGADGVTCAAQVMPGYAGRGYATEEELATLKRTVESYDLELLILRLDPTATAGVLYGKPERDQEIKNICATIRAEISCK